MSAERLRERTFHRITKGSMPVVYTLAVAGIMGFASACAAPPKEQEIYSERALSGDLPMDGSSTTYIITEAITEEFRKRHPEVRVTIGISGTGGGFQKFCNGEIYINNASRPISAEEQKACEAKGIKYIELPVALDGIAIVANPKNNWAETLTVEELKLIWEPNAEGKIKNWKQVRPTFPDIPLTLHGPGTDSGTFDFFTEVIVGKTKASRGDFNANEDDNTLVRGVQGDDGALGYFGYAYYQENEGSLKLLGVDASNNGHPLKPSPETISDGTYKLSRPLSIYINIDHLSEPQVTEFLRFYMDEAPKLVSEVGYFPLPDLAYQENLKKLAPYTP